MEIGELTNFDLILGLWRCWQANSGGQCDTQLYYFNHMTGTCVRRENKLGGNRVSSQDLLFLLFFFNCYFFSGERERERGSTEQGNYKLPSL